MAASGFTIGFRALPGGGCQSAQYNMWGTVGTSSFLVDPPSGGGGGGCGGCRICCPFGPGSSASPAYSVTNPVLMTVTEALYVNGHVDTGLGVGNSGFFFDSNITIYDVTQGTTVATSLQTLLSYQFSTPCFTCRDTIPAQIFTPSFSYQVQAGDYYIVWAGVWFQCWISAQGSCEGHFDETNVNPVTQFKVNYVSVGW